MTFEIYMDHRGSRSGPHFVTADRALASDVAHAMDAVMSGDRSLAMLMVDDENCILNEDPDWRHPDFGRESCKIPLTK